MAHKRYKRNRLPRTIWEFQQAPIPIAVLDAGVLSPMMLGDTLLRAAAADCFRARWSFRILDKVTRNLISDYGMEPARARVLRVVMEEAFPDANVEGWEELEQAMRNHPKDRRVAAAAAAIGAGIIITSNSATLPIFRPASLP